MTQKSSKSPFHNGEQRVQEKLGVRHVEAWAQKVVRQFLPEQHRDFHTALPFLIVSALDAAGRPWVSLLSGPSNFITSPDPHHLVLNAKPVSGDGLENAFTLGADVGILGIELATRRRNRVNGRIVSITDGKTAICVDQTFGNCPQYIREREWQRVVQGQHHGAISTGSLSTEQINWIKCADTFFIGTGYRGEGESPTYGMDASHRGGEKGFVKVLNSKQIQFPDFAGNNHYNTLGNLAMNPLAGLLFINFPTGGLLQLTGSAVVEWEPCEVDQSSGVQRLIGFKIDQVIELPFATDLRWQTDAESTRSLRLVDKIMESNDVMSFIFKSRDGGPLATFEPGQHLPIEIEIPGVKGTARRTYSLSGDQKADHYRISVKRQNQGLVSNHLHDGLKIGSVISSRQPSGEFVMNCNECPLVLISAGVGITPMISMLMAITTALSKRPVWFIYGARNGAHHPFADEVRELIEGHGNLNLHVVYSQPRKNDALGVDYDSKGHITAELVSALTENMSAHYYICGPTMFMAQVQAGLEEQNIPALHIHSETFGAAG